MKIKINILFFTLFMLCHISLMAQQITLEDARSRAKSFFQKHQESSKRFMAKPSSSEPELVYTASQLGETHFYVFNQPEGGWVMIGGDEACQEILAYSEEGTFDYSTSAPNLKNWLRGYEEEISQAIKENATTSSIPDIKKGIRNATLGNKIEALIMTKWDQEAPYYNLCPQYKGERCVTGCVATAMSQIMYYWQWPKVGIGEKSYYDQYGCRKNLSANFSEHEYQWDQMALTTKNFKTTVQKDAVAQLMYDAGVSVSMSYLPYSEGGSGAYSEDIPDAMFNYFCYERANCIYRVDYSKSEWCDIIYKELSEGRPIIYGGEDKNYEGHEFICDGYEYKNNNHYFHFNWGWSGDENGFYTLETTGKSSQFKNNQDAIIGTKPRSGNPCVVLLADDNTLLVPSEGSNCVNLPEHKIGGYTIEGWAELDIPETTSNTPSIVNSMYTAGKDTTILYPVYSFKKYNSSIEKYDTILFEDFASAKLGSNKTTSTSNIEWEGSTNFPDYELYNVFQAGGAIRLGTESAIGSISSRAISVEKNQNLIISFDVKGWTTVEGKIKLILDNMSCPITYYNTISEGFVRPIIPFQSTTKDLRFYIETSKKRAFIDNVLLTTDNIYDRRIYFTTNTIFSAELGSKDDQWSTFFAPFDVTLDNGMVAYDVVVNNGKAALSVIANGKGSIIPANTPVVLFCKEPTQKTVSGQFNPTIPASQSEILTGSLSIILNNGFKSQPSNSGYTNYILSANKSKASLEKVTEKSKLEANRAYFILPEGTDISSLFDNSTDIFATTRKTDSADKNIYNLNGQKEQNPTRSGIYIINGKKKLIKY